MKRDDRFADEFFGTLDDDTADVFGDVEADPPIEDLLAQLPPHWYAALRAIIQALAIDAKKSGIR